MAVIVVLAFAATGCHEYVNTFGDDLTGGDRVTTASVDGLRNQPTAGAMRQRSFETSMLSPQDGTVGHYPLWFEDPFETKGSENGQFAMDWEDYFAMPYGLGRFIVNGIGVPISAVVQPPVPLMGSDGVLLEQYWMWTDAQWHPTGASPTPPDILEIGSVPAEAPLTDV